MIKPESKETLSMMRTPALMMQLGEFPPTKSPSPNIPYHLKETQRNQRTGGRHSIRRGAIGEAS
jgi:hypothetical protein